MNKSRVATFFLSFLPGLGHMYIGLTNRGIQVLIAFLGTIFITDTLDIFEFLTPIIWFISLFDALQQHRNIKDTGIVVDQPLIEWGEVKNKKQLIGWGLIILGVFYSLDRISIYFIGWEVFDVIRNIFLGLVLVYVGYRLVIGKNVLPEKRREETIENTKERE
ncbi:hypothetical protein LCL95_04000 [Bacillus timonensis]|nr:hypothetical protein [Bacillus timonensis]